MESQSQIKRTLSTRENIELVRALLKTDYAGPRPRTDLANEVCQRLGFINALGQTQSSTCLKALRYLEAAGHFVLPEGGKDQEKKPKKKHTPRSLPEAVPEPQDAPATAGEVQNLHWVLAESELQIRTWNELMLREHPQGAGPLVGRQLRYLLGSDHGWLGGLGFGASALHLHDRDRWIGWNWDIRRGQLHRVVGLSRFLIRPKVHCRNLASRVLALCMKRFPQDFEARYGFQPWLVETFVDREHFAGTCFRAANWQWVGRTKGRGRQDRDMTMGESVKDIYIYPLEPSFRILMGLPPNSHRLRFMPPAYPVSDPSAPITLWQGITIPTGLLAFAMPTARSARGLPILRAIWRYEQVVPTGISRSADHTRPRRSPKLTHPCSRKLTHR